MALRNQPYLPLYVQDFLTDEKLIECSASTTGVYIRLMCIMHKSDNYGIILLKQKDKQSEKQILNFALKIAKQMPFTADEILNALTELVNENVLLIDGDKLIQRRMVKDNELSEKRSQAGKVGGEKSYFAKAKFKANLQANTEYENENENENINRNINESKSKKPKFNFELAMQQFGFSEHLITEWMQVRKTKKMTNSETAFYNFVNEVKKINIDKNELLKLIITKSWGGFEAKWYHNQQSVNTAKELGPTASFHTTDYTQKL